MYTWVSHRVIFTLFLSYGISVFILLVCHFSLSQSLSLFLIFFILSLCQSLSLLLSFLWLFFILFYFFITVSYLLIPLNFIWLVIWFDIQCDSIIFVNKSVIFHIVLLIVMSDIVLSLITMFISAWSERTNVGCPSW